MSSLVRVRFIHPYGPYNAGEIAGLQEAPAKKLTGGKRPVAVVVTDEDLKNQPGKMEAALDALPVEVRDFLSSRFASDIKDARKGLLDEVEKIRGELKPLQAQAAEKDALIEKQKARIGELEQQLLAAQQKAEAKGSKK